MNYDNPYVRDTKISALILTLLRFHTNMYIGRLAKNSKWLTTAFYSTIFYFGADIPWGK